MSNQIHCPLCGRKAYVGFNEVDCPNTLCKNYVPEEKPKLMPHLQTLSRLRVHKGEGGKAPKSRIMGADSDGRPVILQEDLELWDEVSDYYRSVINYMDPEEPT